MPFTPMQSTAVVGGFLDTGAKADMDWSSLEGSTPSSSTTTTPNMVAVSDFSVPWHFRLPGGSQRPALGLLEYGQSRQHCWDRVASVGAAIGVDGGHLRRGLGRAVVVVAVLDFSVPWHFRQSGGSQRPALGPLECARPRQYCWDRIAAVGAGISAVGGHLRRDLGRAVVVVAVLDFSVPWHFRQSGGPQRPALGLLGHGQSRQHH